MSTKVYDAWRLKNPETFWSFITWAEPRAYESACAQLAKTFEEYVKHLQWKPDVLNRKVANYSKPYYEFDTWQAIMAARTHLTMAMMREGYRDSSIRGIRTAFNFDLSMTFRHHRKDIYLQLTEDYPMEGAFDFIRKSGRVEDFHYQNSTDRPDGIGPAAWAERRDVWDALYSTDDRRRCSVTTQVMSFFEFTRWSVLHEHEMAKHIRNKTLNWQINEKTDLPLAADDVMDKINAD